MFSIVKIFCITHVGLVSSNFKHGIWTNRENRNHSKWSELQNQRRSGREPTACRVGERVSSKCENTPSSQIWLRKQLCNMSTECRRNSCTGTHPFPSLRTLSLPLCHSYNQANWVLWRFILPWPTLLTSSLTIILHFYLICFSLFCDFLYISAFAALTLFFQELFMLL
jgi:hypothetical protein